MIFPDVELQLLVEKLLGGAVDGVRAGNLKTERERGDGRGEIGRALPISLLTRSNQNETSRMGSKGISSKSLRRSGTDSTESPPFPPSDREGYQFDYFRCKSFLRCVFSPTPSV